MRDKIIDEIRNIASDILAIPQDSFSSSDYAEKTIVYLGVTKFHELIARVKAIYKNARSIINVSFEAYSLEDLREINSIIFKINANIKYLKGFHEYRRNSAEEEFTKLLEDIKNNSKILETKLENNSPEKYGLEEGRVQAIEEIKVLVNTQLSNSIEELLNSEAIKMLIKRIEDKNKLTQISSNFLLEILKKTYTVLSIISLSSLSSFSRSTLDSIIEKTHELVDLLQEIKEFEIQNVAPDTGQAIKLIIKYSDSLQAITHEIGPHMTYFIHEIAIKPDLFPLVAKFNESRGESDSMSKQIEFGFECLERKHVEIEKSMLELKKVASLVAVKSQKEIYANRSINFKHESYLWLRVTVALACLAIGAACYLLFFVKPSVDLTTAFSELPLRVVILGMLISATIWCGRNYRSLKHQSVANMEREDVINTFHAFVESAYDKKVRDLVLLEAVRSVFKPSPSGFVDHSTGQDSHGPFNLTNSGNFDKIAKGK